MSDKYFTVNIRAYLDKDEPTYIGEESLYDLLSDFSCPKNPDVEYFLLHNAIEFTKKDQSITYLVFDAEDASLVGYFSLTIKPISVRASNISKTISKKLSRVKIFLLWVIFLGQWGGGLFGRGGGAGRGGGGCPVSVFWMKKHNPILPQLT